MHTFCHASKCFIAQQDQLLFVTCVARFRAAQVIWRRKLLSNVGNHTVFLNIIFCMTLSCKRQPFLLCNAWDRDISLQSSPP